VTGSNTQPLYLVPRYAQNQSTLTIDINAWPNLYAPLFDTDFRFENKRFSQIIYRFDRWTRWFSDKQLAISKIKRAYKVWNKHAAVSFDAINVSQKSVHQKRGDLYKKNKFYQLIKQNPQYWDRPLKIPPVFHKIWVTHKNNPLKIPTEYLDRYKQTHQTSGKDWSFMLWIQDFDHQPGLQKDIEQNYPFITIRFITELGDFNNLKHANQAIEAGNFRKASDILRYQILHKEGGVYMDTDFHTLENLSPYNYLYDFYISQESISTRLCNALIGAAPGHPVMEKAIELVDSNLTTKPAYIKNSRIEPVMLETGPDMISVAFYQKADQPGYTDIVLPPFLFIPQNPPLYPDFKTEIDNKIPLTLLAYHSYDSAS
jgi:mannosyltransferase OCH1-like enzyme